MRRMQTATETLERLIVTRGPVDLRLTLRTLRHGRADPSFLRHDDEWWRATRTPDGPATTRFAPEGDDIRATAWGPGAAWAIDHAGPSARTTTRPRSTRPTDWSET